MYKADLHTHSEASPDGGLTAEQYARILSTGQLDVVAVTDHNKIDFATRLASELGDRIIVGEEIMSNLGEIIGLYLKEHIRPGLSPLETVKQIKEQGGLVYIPHPFETIRKGLHPAVLDELIDYIDIIEVANGRVFWQNRSAQAAIWARLNRVVGAASSDAHGIRGIGRTFTQLNNLPRVNTLLHEIAHGAPYTERPAARALLYPRYHRLRKKIRRQP